MADHAIPDDDLPVALVTGASSGIGRAVAIEFARRQDAHLVLAARRLDELDITAAMAADVRAGSGRVVTIVADLATQDGIDAVVAAVHAVGRLDVLVNNAGVGGEMSFDAPSTIRDVDHLLALNLRTPLLLTHELLPMLRASRGTIINISSVAGLIGTPDAEVYSSTKWAITGFSEALRASQSRHGVRVTCVHPGPVPTPGWPHARLSRSWFSRNVLASDVGAIARACERASRGRGGPSPVRPRTYAIVPLLRGVTPWLVRGSLAWAARRDLRSKLHAPIDQEPST